MRRWKINSLLERTGQEGRGGGGVFGPRMKVRGGEEGPRGGEKRRENGQIKKQVVVVVCGVFFVFQEKRNHLEHLSCFHKRLLIPILEYLLRKVVALIHSL